MLLAGVLRFESLQRMSGTQTDQLITGGIYRYSRNPQNVGWILGLLGMSILGDSAVALVLTGLFALIFRTHLPREEAHLERIYDEAYRRYRQRTPRYLGLPKTE